MDTPEELTIEQLLVGRPLEVQDFLSKVFNLGYAQGVADTTEAIHQQLEKIADARIDPHTKPLPTNRQQRKQHHAELQAHLETLVESSEMPFATCIEDLRFTMTTYNVLKREHVHTVRDLLFRSYDDVVAMRGIGEKSVVQIREKLWNVGYVLMGDTNERPVKSAKRLHFEGLTEHPNLPFASPLEQLGRSNWPYRALKNSGIRTVGQLLNMSMWDLSLLHHVGDASLRKLNEQLGWYGYSLYDDMSVGGKEPIE